MFDGISIASLTPPALLGIAVLLVFFGRLIPWFVYQSKIQECEKWQKAYEAEREARVTSVAQTAELLELAKTTHSIIDAAFGPTARHRKPSGGAYVVHTPTGE